MRHSTRATLIILLAAGSFCVNSPAIAAGFHVGINRPAAAYAPRSSASRITARANANANNAAGNPYVNPNVAGRHRTTKDNASANAEAAEIRSAHVDVGPQ